MKDSMISKPPPPNSSMRMERHHLHGLLCYRISEMAMNYISPLNCSWVTVETFPVHDVCPDKFLRSQSGTIQSPSLPPLTLYFIKSCYFFGNHSQINWVLMMSNEWPLTLLSKKGWNRCTPTSPVSSSLLHNLAHISHSFTASVTVQCTLLLKPRICLR